MTTYTYIQTYVENGTIEIEPINDDYSAVRVTAGTKVSDHSYYSDDESKGLSQRKAPKEIEESGIMTVAQVNKLKRGGSIDFKNFVALTDEQLEVFRTHFYMDAWEKVGKKTADVFDAATSGVGTLVELVHDCHMLRNIDGDVLPVAIHFDYIQSNLSNNRYYMRKTLDHLAARDDILWLDGRGREGEPEILDIPHYNRDRDRDRYLEFMWTPTVEDYRRMWDQCTEYHMASKWPHSAASTYKYEAIRELDILGIEQFVKVIDSDDDF